jgi:hypothetical protein
MMNRSFTIACLIFVGLSGSLMAMEAPLKRTQITADQHELLLQIYNEIHQIGLELLIYAKANAPKKAGDLEQYNHLNPNALQELGILGLQLPTRFEGLQSEVLKFIESAINFNSAYSDNDKKLLNDLITQFKEANKAAGIAVDETEPKALPRPLPPTLARAPNMPSQPIAVNAPVQARIAAPIRPQAPVSRPLPPTPAQAPKISQPIAVNAPPQAPMPPKSPQTSQPIVVRPAAADAPAAAPGLMEQIQQGRALKKVEAAKKVENIPVPQKQKWDKMNYDELNDVFKQKSSELAKLQLAALSLDTIQKAAAKSLKNAEESEKQRKEREERQERIAQLQIEIAQLNADMNYIKNRLHELKPNEEQPWD